MSDAMMEPVTGIEPAFPAWKADALAIEVHRLERRTLDPRIVNPPLSLLNYRHDDAVRPERFELPTSRFEACHSIR